jgi:hypothetical protein
VESCLKAWLRDRRYRKYSDVYQADLDMIKQIVDGCNNIGELKLTYQSKAESKLGGGSVGLENPRNKAST